MENFAEVERVFPVVEAIVAVTVVVYSFVVVGKTPELPDDDDEPREEEEGEPQPPEVCAGVVVKLKVIVGGVSSSVVKSYSPTSSSPQPGCG